MTPNLLGSSSLFLAEASSAEPVQIISTPGPQHSYNQYQRPLRKQIKSNVPQYKWDILWRNVLIFLFLHSVSVYGIWLLITQTMWKSIIFRITLQQMTPNKFHQSVDFSKPSVCILIHLAKTFDIISHKRILEKLKDFVVRGICHKLFEEYLNSYLKNLGQHVNINNYFSLPKTVLWLPQVYVYALVAGMGITAGAHRLWAHRTYKAKLPLRIFLMICQSASLQNHIYEWVRDHRVHHKFTDTDADPHNSRRGFFFSHMRWLMVKKHKDVFIKGKTVDLSDLWCDSKEEGNSAEMWLSLSEKNTEDLIKTWLGHTTDRIQRKQGKYCY